MVSLQFVFIVIIAVANSVCGFLPLSSRYIIRNHDLDFHSPMVLQLISDESSTTSLSKQEMVLNDFFQSQCTFRIVVIGNGAILETTSKLGPKMATSISPKTGDKLMTFASEDASFEFHVKVDQICTVNFVSTERPNGEGGSNIMRVSRFLNEKGESVCSLILADDTTEAIAWFDGMVEKYGEEAVM